MRPSDLWGGVSRIGGPVLQILNMTAHMAIPVRIFHALPAPSHEQKVQVHKLGCQSVTCVLYSLTCCACWASSDFCQAQRAALVKFEVAF